MKICLGSKLSKGCGIEGGKYTFAVGYKSLCKVCAKVLKIERDAIKKLTITSTTFSDMTTKKW